MRNRFQDEDATATATACVRVCVLCTLCLRNCRGVIDRATKQVAYAMFLFVAREKVISLNRAIRVRACVCFQAGYQRPQTHLQYMYMYMYVRINLRTSNIQMYECIYICMLADHG